MSFEEPLHEFLVVPTLFNIELGGEGSILPV